MNQWKSDSKGWCFLGNDGNWLTNTFQNDSQGLCYLDANGYWFKTGGWKQNSSTKAWYYMGSNGYAVKNAWMKDSTGWCYLGADGAWVTNDWVKDSKGWCFIGANGYWDGKAQIQAGNINELNDGASHSGMYIISASGSYGSADASKPTTINGNVIINYTDASSKEVINLNNMTIKGKLTVNFGAGTLNLNNVKVADVDVLNVGSSSFNCNDNTVVDNLFVQDLNNDAHIVANGSARIINTTLNSGALIEARGTSTAPPFQIITVAPVTAPSSANTVTFTGGFSGSSVSVLAPANLNLAPGAMLGTLTANDDLSIIGQGSVGVLTLAAPTGNLNLGIPTVGTLVVGSGASGSSIVIPSGTTVSTLDVNAPATVSGTGSITNANIGASGTVIETAPGTTSVVSGVTATVGGQTANSSNSNVINEVPAPGQTPSSGDSGSGGSGGGGGSTGTTYSVSAVLGGDLSGVSVKNGVADVSGKASSLELSDIIITTKGYNTIKSVAVKGYKGSSTINVDVADIALTDNDPTTFNVSTVLGAGKTSISLGTLREKFGDYITFTFATDDDPIVIDVILDKVTAKFTGALSGVGVTTKSDGSLSADASNIDGSVILDEITLHSKLYSSITAVSVAGTNYNVTFDDPITFGSNDTANFSLSTVLGSAVSMGTLRTLFGNSATFTFTVDGKSIPVSIQLNN